YRVHGTQPAAQLHRQGRLFADRFHLTRVYGAAFHRAVEIDDVDERRTFLHPVTRRVQRPLEVDGLFVHVALKQAHTTAVLDIDCRNNEHGANDQRRIARSSKECAIPAPGSSPGETDWQKADPSQYSRRTGCRNPWS